MNSKSRSRIVERCLPAVLALLAGVLAGCATAPDEARYRPSQGSTPLPNAAGSFAAYLRAVNDHLARARVPHRPDEPAWELRANAPFEMAPDPENCGAASGRPERGILLIHGLSGSPYTFRGLGRDLAERCFLVRTVLLPGHGTRPGDMLEVGHEDWIAWENNLTGEIHS